MGEDHDANLAYLTAFISKSVLITAAKLASGLIVLYPEKTARFMATKPTRAEGVFTRDHTAFMIKVFCLIGG